MRRRSFLRRGAALWAAISLGGVRRSFGSAPVSRPDDGPVVLSTWRFGLQANREAMRRLASDDGPLDAAVAGAMLVEADPTVQTVGIGGLPNRDGDVELDAAVIEGATLRTGAVAGLRRIKHPVAVARAVMERTDHVLLVGAGARKFALSHGFRSGKLLTAEARAEWRARRGVMGKAGASDHDTLGILTRAADGRMAAACTTSGRAFKLPGRVGDSPLVGHGLYCDDGVGAAVATGMGEEVIRVCGSYQVVEFMRQGLSPTEAVRRVLLRMRRRAGASALPFVGFAALRSDGATGWLASQPGFVVALSRDDRHELVEVAHLGSAKAGE